VEIDQFRLKFLTSEENLLKLMRYKQASLKIILIELEYNQENLSQILRKLKSSPYSKDIPIIFLAEDVHEGQTKAAIDLGAFSVLEKPANSEFMKTIVELINILIM
ncbi:MAG: hypothetical protein AAFR87_17335, partial [Bacteroidota bacterium]